MAVELKDFVKAALIDIATAVKEAQQVVPVGTIIAPTVSFQVADKPTLFWDRNHGYSLISEVEFDVAVTAFSGTAKDNEKSIGIQVVEAVLGYSNKDRKTESSSVENLSKIKFSVPIVYPQKIPKLEELMKNQ